MVQAFLIKYSEIGIKGKNRYMFEDALRDRVAEKLKKCEGTFAVQRENGRIYVEAKSEYDYSMDMHTSSGGARLMKKGSKLAILIGVVAAIAAVVASLSALLLYLDRKRDDEELEHYLDCSIQ